MIETKPPIGSVWRWRWRNGGGAAVESDWVTVIVLSNDVDVYRAGTRTTRVLQLYSNGIINEGNWQTAAFVIDEKLRPVTTGLMQIWAGS